MEATKRFREKYRAQEKNYVNQQGYATSHLWTPAGSKDVLRLCEAVEGMKRLIEDAIHYIDNPVLANRTRGRLNMILMELGESRRMGVRG